MIYVLLFLTSPPFSHSLLFCCPYFLSLFLSTRQCSCTFDYSPILRALRCMNFAHRTTMYMTDISNTCINHRHQTTFSTKYWRRKSTRTKYDPPYIKKTIIKGAGNSNHVSVEEVSLDGSNKLITYGNQFR